MSWYVITLLVILSIIVYIVVWSLTTLALGRWAKNSDPGWIVAGMLWPIVLVCVPFVAAILFVEKIVEKYGYRGE